MMTGEEVARWNLPPQIEAMVLFACELWIESGHDINTYGFVTNFIEIFLEDAKKSNSLENNASLFIDSYSRGFMESHPELKTRTISARDKKKSKANFRPWISLVEGPIKKVHPATGYCIFTAREFGLVTERTKTTRSASVQRPRNTDRERRKVASAIYLVSMAGEFYPPHVMMRNEDEMPSDYEEFGGFKVASNQTGWASRRDWFNWLINEFDPATQRYTEGGHRWRLLFVDSYYSPIKEEFFVESLKRGILCIAYPTSKTVDKLDPFSCGEIFYDIDQIYKAWLQGQWENRGAADKVLISREYFIQVLSQIMLGETQNRNWKAQTLRGWQKSQMFGLLSAQPDSMDQAAVPHVMQVPENQPIPDNDQKISDSDSVIAFDSPRPDNKQEDDELEYDELEYESLLAELALDDSYPVEHCNTDTNTSRRRKHSLEPSDMSPDPPRPYQRPRQEQIVQQTEWQLPIRSAISTPYYASSNLDSAFYPRKIETPDLSLPPPPLSGSVSSHDFSSTPDTSQTPGLSQSVPEPSQSVLGPSQPVPEPPHSWTTQQEHLKLAYHCVAATLYGDVSTESNIKILGMMASLVNKLAETH